MSEDSTVKIEEIDFEKSKSAFDKLNLSTIKKFLFFKCKKIEVPEKILQYIDRRKWSLIKKDKTVKKQGECYYFERKRNVRKNKKRNNWRNRQKRKME